MAASTLTSKQQRFVLRASQKKKKTVKNVLLPPIQKKWTRIRPEDAQLFKEKLQKAFEELNLKRTKLRYGRGKDKLANKEEALKKRSEQLSKEQVDLRSQLVVGLNAVTRGLEKKRLRLVLVDANTRPSTLTNHLLWLAESSCCRCIAVPDLLETLGDILNVTSLIAMGFTNDPPEQDKFIDVIQLVEEHSEVQKTPNKDESELGQGHTEEANSEEEEEGMNISGEAEIDEIDYRDLYILKKDLPSIPTQSPLSEPLKARQE